MGAPGLTLPLSSTPPVLLRKTSEVKLPVPGAAYWSDDEQVFVSAYQPADERSHWDVYVEGLQQCYSEFGAGHIVERVGLDRQDCRLFFLVRDVGGSVLGGIRAVGPVTKAERVGDIPALAELSASPTTSILRAALHRVLDRGVVEVKGAWSAPGVTGLGDLFARLFWHCGWWLSADHVLVTSGVEQSIGKWTAFGGRAIPGMEPARDFPVPGHHTIPLLLAMDDMADLAPEVQDRLVAERGYLHQARHGGDIAVGAGHEIVMGAPELARLEAGGVTTRSMVDDLRAEAADCLGSSSTAGDPAASYPWIHYPWRGEAIQILGPRLFHLLRTDRNRHKLTAEDLRLLRRKKIGVIGLSVGNSIAYTLAQEGLCGELRLADFDTLELTNLNRLSASLTELGIPKTTIAARRIAELDPYLDVRLYPDGIDRTNLDRFLAGLDLVIEECDSLDVKVMVRQAAAERGVPVIMETNDRGLLDIERFDLDASRRPFHGLIGDVDVDKMAGLSTDDKVPYLIGILDADGISADMAASLVEIDETISSWPQLASDVALGAALAATAARDLLLDRSRRSGRIRIDLSQLATGPEDPPQQTRPDPPPALIQRSALPAEFDEAIVAAARLAPSGGNIQPWRFSLSDENFSVDTDGEQVGMDIGGRGTAVACGAAMFNALCVAAAHGRLAAVDGRSISAVDTELDLDSPDRIATLALGSEADSELAALAEQIPRRTTNRRLDPVATQLDDSARDALCQAAAAAGGQAYFLTPAELGDLPAIWAESDRLRFLDERLHRELFEEIRRPGLDKLDRGLDERTLELSVGDLAKQSILRRADVMARLSDWDAGNRLGEDITKRLAQSAGLLVLAVDGDARSDYVRGGMALQWVWLEAARLEIGLQPVSPVFGYARTTTELTDLLGLERGVRLAELQAQAFETIGLDEDQAFILALRAHLAPPPSAISERVVGADRTAEQRSSGTVAR